MKNEIQMNKLQVSLNPPQNFSQTKPTRRKSRICPANNSQQSVNRYCRVHPVTPFCFMQFAVLTLLAFLHSVRHVHKGFKPQFQKIVINDYVPKPTWERFVGLFSSFASKHVRSLYFQSIEQRTHKFNSQDSFVVKPSVVDFDLLKSSFLT